MEWLGFATLITAYGCIFTAVVTGRKGWVLLMGWLIPILALTITYEPGMQINGLMVLICHVPHLQAGHGGCENVEHPPAEKA